MRRIHILTLRCFGALALGGLLLFSNGPAQALVTVVKDAGQLTGTAVIDGAFRSLGSDMVGMSVTVQYETGAIVSGVWGVDNAATQTGSASVTDFFSTSVSGDTWSSAWTFVNAAETAISRIIFDAGLGNAFFDTTSPGPGTLGSAAGRDFQLLSGSVGDITATYRDEVGLIDAVTGDLGAPAGDVFRVLQLDFAGAEFGGGETIAFRVDTDNAFGMQLEADDIPEPASFLILTAGLLALSRRRAAKNS